MDGLIEEGKELMSSNANDDVMDVLLVAAAQKVEHYEIATYGTLCTWAEVLGYSNALSLLKENIKEEESADKKLTKLSQSINAAAVA